MREVNDFLDLFLDGRQTAPAVFLDQPSAPLRKEAPLANREVDLNYALSCTGSHSCS